MGEFGHYLERKVVFFKNNAGDIAEYNKKNIIMQAVD